MFLASNIFDIDDALDKLEENLFTSSEEKSAISNEPLSQQQKNDTVNLQQQQSKAQEENGNVVALSVCGGEPEFATADENKGELFWSDKGFFNAIKFCFRCEVR